MSHDNIERQSGCNDFIYRFYYQSAGLPQIRTTRICAHTLTLLLLIAKVRDAHPSVSMLHPGVKEEETIISPYFKWSGWKDTSVLRSVLVVGILYIIVVIALHTGVCVFQWYKQQQQAAAAALVRWPACWATVRIDRKIIKTEAKSMEMCLIKTYVRITYRTWHQFTHWAPPAKFKTTLSYTLCIIYCSCRRDAVFELAFFSYGKRNLLKLLQDRLVGQCTGYIFWRIQSLQHEKVFKDTSVSTKVNNPDSKKVYNMNKKECHNLLILYDKY